MSYKKQQPKITDTLDVFIDRVEAINDSIKKLNHFNNELDQKINAVQNMKLKVDISELKNESSKINSSLSQISKDTLSGLSLIHISEPTRRVVISYAVFCLKNSTALMPLSLIHI